jgi:hypothetical protein
MKRPPLEVADIIRAVGKSFIDNNRSWLNRLHLKVLSAIECCRTAALGGHRDRCTRCGYQTTSYSYNSCRNRHCGKCQTNARDKWLAARSQELLPVAYVHVVFTLPHQLAPLVFHNKRILYDLLFKTSAATLLEIAADPQHLGAEIGFLSVLHTWGQTLQHHPHVHCVIPAGGLSADHQRWIHPRYRFFVPVEVLSPVFRGKFVAGLKRAWRRGDLCLPGSLKPLAEKKMFGCYLRSLHQKQWVVYAKPPFGGPQHVLHYLARYTHRVAISNHRLVDFTDGKLTFRWKDYARGSKKTSHDAQRRRVSPALSVAHATTRFRAYSLVRLSRQPAPGHVAPAMPAVTANKSSAAFLRACQRIGASTVAVPAMRRPDGGDRAAQRSATPLGVGPAQSRS